LPHCRTVRRHRRCRHFPQQPAGSAVLPRAGRAVGPVADEGTLQQQLGGAVDQVQHLLLQGLPGVGNGRGVGRLGAGVPVRAGNEVVNELLVKRRGPGAEGLIPLAAI
jgi:hypothetical protein